MMHQNEHEEQNSVASDAGPLAASSLPCMLTAPEIKELTDYMRKTVIATLSEPIVAPDGNTYTAIYGTLVSDLCVSRVFESAVVIGDGTPVFVRREIIRSMVVTSSVSMPHAGHRTQAPYFIADRVIKPS
jgi:hypothetical protein